MKKVFLVALIVMLMISFTPTNQFGIVANAATEYASGDYFYKIINTTQKTVCITDYTGTATNLTIPSTLNGYKVVEIGCHVCEENENIRSVQIPEGVVVIGDYAFNRCVRLNDITIPSTVQKMGYDAFGVNDLRYDSGKVNIKDLYSWCNIEFGDFSIYNIFVSKDLYVNGEKITDLIIPNGITQIKDHAFTYLNIKSVYLPSSVTYIGDLAFSRTDIEKVYIEDINDFINITTGSYNHQIFGDYSWDLLIGKDKITDIAIPSGVLSIAPGLFNSCKSIETINIPGTVKYLDNSFQYCNNLREVIIDYGVEEISHSFYRSGTAVDEFFVSVPASVSYISYQAFDVEADILIECIENSYTHQRVPSLMLPTYDLHTFDNRCDLECNQCDYQRRILVGHQYDANCDAICNECGYARDALPHTYDSLCGDTDCNECGHVRTIQHSYSNLEDLSCNVCYESLTPNAPSIENKNATTITLTEVLGCEYSLDGKNWQESPNFANLTPEKEYTFYQRVKETATSKQSGISNPTKAKTLKGYTIIFSYNDGSKSNFTKIKTKGVNLSLGSVSKSGYVFLGWSLTPNGTTFISLYEDDESATFYAKWAYECSTCSGGGQTSTTVQQWVTCDTCNGKGEVSKKDTTNLRCMDCGSKNLKTEYIPNSLGYGERRYCGVCNSENIGKGYVDVSCCTSCSGIGQKLQNVTKWVTCTSCDGKGKHKSPQPKAPMPTIKSKGENFIELEAQYGAEYSIDGMSWQISPMFSNLPSSKYYIYQRYVSTSVNTVGEASEPLVVEVHSHIYSNNCDKSCNVCGKARTVGAHKYSNSCDTTCNYCNAKRTIKHTYSNSCDTTCNVCKAKRTIKHTYSNNCDTSCNVCKATRTITHAYKTTTTKATLTKNGSIVKKCTVCGKVVSNTAIKYAKILKLSTTTYTYDGKAKTPSVTVNDSAGKTLKKNTDYTVTYASGRKNVGTYKVTIKMIGKYSGTKTLTFKINPAKTTVSKLTAGKNSITVAITKKSTQVTGYQIQYSTSKKFTNAKTKTISSYKTTKYTLKSLSAKKTYYVRVRTYKKVGSTTYYSGWSTYKYVKTK